ncbi:MAG TPA: LysM peptidoglycan-binding domain-containing protein [Limnochordales bacterium]
MHASVARSQQHRARLAYVAAIVAVAGALVLLLIPHVFSQTLTPVQQEYVDVVVRDGDTLWQIARRHAGPGADPRQMVERIRAANGLETAVVRPGQVLKVPVP